MSRSRSSRATDDSRPRAATACPRQPIGRLRWTRSRSSNDRSRLAPNSVPVRPSPVRRSAGIRAGDCGTSTPHRSCWRFPVPESHPKINGAAGGDVRGFWDNEPRGRMLVGASDWMKRSADVRGSSSAARLCPSRALFMRAPVSRSRPLSPRAPRSNSDWSRRAGVEPLLIGSTGRGSVCLLPPPRQRRLVVMSELLELRGRAALGPGG